MAKITALIHVHNKDVRTLGRALDSLRPCDQVLVINHGSDKEVENFSRGHGAEALAAVPGVSPGAYLVNAKHDWLLSLLPSEALSESLQASLQQWKEQGDHEDVQGVSINIREESENGWTVRPPETRLVNRNKVNWTGEIPPTDPKAPHIAGDVLRFRAS